MTIRRKLFGAMTALALASVATPAWSATEIQWWHAMGGELGEKLNKIATDFNATQSDYVIVPVYKGNYTETLTAAIAAFRAKENPAIVQVFEVGTATMMGAKGAVYPVYQLMADRGESFDPKNYLSAVTGYYSDTEGNMLSMPFNSSTPVMYYNKTAFEKAGLDPNNPPKTWPELADAARKIIAAGAATCGFTTGWPSWVQLENLSALHNVPFATQDNGFAGFNAELAIDGELHKRHIQALVDWQQEGVFKYGGRRSDSAPLFYSGECAMYMNSSAAQAGVRANAKDFEFGVAMLPYWPGEVAGQDPAAKAQAVARQIAELALDDMAPREALNLLYDLQARLGDGPQNSIIGGATLWVLQGRPAEEYEGVAKFFSYLSSPEVQSWWHQETGYLPITYASYELTKSQGYYENNPGTDVSIKQMTLNEPTPNSKGVRLGNFVQIRDVIDEELEAAFAGTKTVDQALGDAVTRSNELLREFEQSM